MSSVIRSLLNNEVAKTSSGEQVRDLAYVGDVAEAFVALLLSPVQGAVNIGTGKGIALKDVVLEIARQMGKPHLIRLGALPSNPNDPPALVADTQRLNLDVGFNAWVALQRGIAQTIQSIQLIQPVQPTN